MRSFDCSSSQKARAPSSLKQKQTCWVVPVELWKWQLHSTYELSTTFSCSRGEMLSVAVSLPAPCFWLPACFVYLSDVSQRLSHCLEKMLPHGNTQGNSFSFPFHISLLQVQDVMRDGSCLNEREWRSPWLHQGQNFTLGDLLEKWEGISIFTENLQPLIVLKPQIFSSRGKVRLLFQMNVVAERHLLLEILWKRLRTKTGIKEKQGGKGLFAIKHQHKPSWALCLCPSSFLFTHSSSPSRQP